MRTRNQLILAIALSMSCSLTMAKEGDITINGNTTVTGPLLSEIIGPLIQNFAVSTGCHSHTLDIERKVLESPIGKAHHKINPDSLIKEYSAKEEWDVKGCGKVKPLYLDLGRDMYGALMFDISANN